MVDDKKGKETLEADGGDHARVDRDDGIRMVAQKGSPALRRRSSAFDQVFGDRRLRNLEAKLEQFAVDTRCAPERVVLAHLPDQVPQLAVDFRPARPTARSPAPIGPKPCSMPSQDGVGLHHAGQSYQAW